MKKIFLMIPILAIASGCARSVQVSAEQEAKRSAWENGGREQVLEWFRKNQYGVTPIGRPADQVIEERSVSMAGGKIKIDIFLALPDGASKEKPVPVFVMGDHRNDGNGNPFKKEIYAGIPTNSITARGYAYVCFNFNDIAPNTGRGKFLNIWSNGVYQVYGGAERTAESWGTISAWAWGFSRVMDWIEKQPMLDAKRVAIVGHSRGGKTALWAAAQDTRFAMGVSNNSGCGGAKYNKLDLPNSEHIAQILHNFPFWFCLNFQKYAKNDAAVTYDADALISLIAPRLAYVASAESDPWAGPRGEFESAKRAGATWNYYGLKGLSLTEFPQPNAHDHSGKIGYHIRKGKHKLLPSDWELFMDFADKHMK